MGSSTHSAGRKCTWAKPNRNPISRGCWSACSWLQLLIAQGSWFDSTSYSLVIELLEGSCSTCRATKSGEKGSSVSAMRGQEYSWSRPTQECTLYVTSDTDSLLHVISIPVVG